MFLRNIEFDILVLDYCDNIWCTTTVDFLKFVKINSTSESY